MSVLSSSALLLVALTQTGDVWSDVEGALDNDTFLPTDEGATSALARGDRTLLRARDLGRVTDRRDAFDAWRSALESTQTGAAVPLLVQDEGESELLADAQSTFGRRTESIEVAVLRRLLQLNEAEQAEWTTRFEDLAKEALEFAGRSTDQLANVERGFPGTRSAIVACLRLFDATLERGRRIVARTYLSRAEQHARVVRDERLNLAIERRVTALASIDASQASEPEAWRSATGLELVHETRLSVTTSRARRPGEGFERGILSGFAFLDDGRHFLHHSAAAFVFGSEGERGPIFEPEKVIDGFRRKFGRAFAPGGQAWPLHVETNGTDVFCVVGRALGGNSSAVCRIHPPAQAGDPPELRWVFSTRGHADAQGNITPLGEWIEPGIWEIQPGPVLVGTQLIVQARQWIPSEDESGRETFDPSRPRAWVLALDAETGVPNWARFLAFGSDLRIDFGSRFGPSRPAAPAEPPAIAGSRVFCSTSIGIGSSLDLIDGRLLWSFRSRRRDAESEGWVSTHAPITTDETIVWSPGDSDRLYFLNASSGLDGEDLVTQIPLAIDDGRAVIGGTSEEALVLGFAGSAKTISSWNARTGEHRDALHLRRTESFRGGALVSDERVFLCTDKTLYVFDRTRDLYLLESHALRGSGSEGGGAVFAKEDRVVVVGPNRIYIFEVRP